MRTIGKRLFLTLFLSVLWSGTIQAATYKPINEIPNEVPESDEEKGIWQLGIAHQEEVRGTDEVVNDPELERYVEGVVARLMGSMVEDIGMEVDVLIFRDPTVNAWVYPNGTVGVQTGLLAAMENEAQLASIMGHEVSHFLNRHAFIQIKSKQKNSFIGKGLGLLATAAVATQTGTIDTGLMQSGQIYTELVTSGYSRNLENDADEQGLELLIAAGYPPEESLPAFETLRIKDDDQINISKMWSSHPDIDSRMKNLTKQIKRAEASPSEEGLDSSEYFRSVKMAVLSNSQLLVERRQFEAAITSLNNLSEKVPEETRAHYLLGEAHRKQDPEGNFDARIAAYQKAVANDATLAEPHRELGMAFRQQGDIENARQSYTQYLSLAPEAKDAKIIQWYLENLDTASATQAQLTDL